MEALVDRSSQVENGIYVQISFFTELKPEILSDFTCPLDGFLVFNVEFLKFYDLSEITFHIHDFTLLTKELAHLEAELFDNPET